MNELSKALSIVNQRKVAAEEKYKELLNEINKKIPEIEKINDEITTKIELFKHASLARKTDYADKLKKQVDDLFIKKANLLKENGYNEDLVKPIYSCTICNDSGYYNGKLCECVLKEKAHQERLSLNNKYPIPKFYFRNFNLDYYSKEKFNGTNVIPYVQMKNIMAICLKFVKEFNGEGEGLLFVGASGLGKTHLACSIANEIFAKGYKVIFISSQKMFSMLEQEKYSEAGFLEDFLDCDLLVVDDFGTENYSGYSMSTLYQIFNTRMLRKKPCIFTANMLSGDAIKNRYGEKISSRLLRTTKLLYCIGKDVRLVKNNKKNM